MLMYPLLNRLQTDKCGQKVFMNFSGNYDETANPPHLVVMYLPFPSNTGLGAAFGLVTSRSRSG